MNTQMTQAEFEGRMALHAEYLEKVNANQVTALMPTWFKHEDMSNIDTEGYNFDEVSFLHCRLPTMDFRSTTFSRGVVYIDRCTMAGIFANHCPELYLSLTEVQVKEVKLEHIANLNLHISSSRVDRMTISHSALDLMVKGSYLGRTAITDCEGEGIELHTVRGRYSPLSLANNKFEDIRFYDVDSLGCIHMPTWDVNYCGDLLQIGCQSHSIETWKNFTDDEIDFMDRDALEWWKTFKEPVLAIVEANHSKMPSLRSQLRSAEELEQEFKRRTKRFIETKKARQQAKERGDV